jgi:hypothetical protein
MPALAHPELSSVAQPSLAPTTYLLGHLLARVPLRA